MWSMCVTQLCDNSERGDPHSGPGQCTLSEEAGEVWHVA